MPLYSQTSWARPGRTTDPDEAEWARYVRAAEQRSACDRCGRPREAPASYAQGAGTSWGVYAKNACLILLCPVCIEEWRHILAGSYRPDWKEE